MGVWDAFWGLGENHWGIAGYQRCLGVIRDLEGVLAGQVALRGVKDTCTKRQSPTIGTRWPIWEVHQEKSSSANIYLNIRIGHSVENGLQFLNLSVLSSF